MGKEAKRFVDFLEKGGQTYWQILPICPTSYGDSPYQSFSSFAGNPYFIDLELLCKDKLLTKKECESYKWGKKPQYVDYGIMYVNRYALLRKAYERFSKKTPADYEAFCSKEVINSPGGSISAGMAIHDTMQYIKCDVSTICVGMAASMGAFLLSCGAKGKRIALPNAEVMIHQPSAGTQGKVTDMEIDVEHFLKIKQRINKILADNTGKTPEQIKSDSERDNWMTAEEAKEYGLIDDILYKH